MPFLQLILALLLAATPPPPPPPPPLLVTPQPSPSATAAAALTVSGPLPVNLHPGQTQTLTIQNGSGKLGAGENVPLVTASVDQTARTVTITASQQTGSSVVTVTDQTGAAVQIPVRVALDAGSVAPSLTLRVTGTQVDTQWLTLLVQKALLQSAQLQPGASVQIQPFTLPPVLGPGASAAVPVPVTISGGPQYFDVHAWPTVTLQNVAVDPFTAQILLYDDDPEKIAQSGVLFRGQVDPGVPSRLYYYHENSGKRRDLAVVLSTGVSQPSTVQLIDASAGPSEDVMGVGHDVSRDFLLRKPLDEGIVVDVDSRTPYVADRFSMGSLQGAAGSIGIRILDGGPVTVTVLALPAGDAASPQLAAYLSQPQLPGDGHDRTGAFSLVDYADDTLHFTVGGPAAGKQYGIHTPPAAQLPADPVRTGHDYGDYGVIRTLNFEIDNPQNQPATVYLYERPLGGGVRSSFLVDGELVQVGCARLADRYEIGPPLTAAPGATTIIPVQTMTDGGSSYPIEVGISSRPPLPSVPPLNAPDGCFPKPQTAPEGTPAPQAGTPAPAGSPAPPPAPSSLPSSAPMPAPEPTGRPA